MGKKSGTQTASTAPWQPAQANLRFGLSELDRIYGGGAPTREQFMSGPSRSGGGLLWGGDPSDISALAPPGYGVTRRTTAPTSFDQAGYDQAMSQWQSQQQAMPHGVNDYGMIDPAMQEIAATVRGDRFNQNPYMDDVIARSMQDVNSQFSGMSRYGSGAHMDQLFTKAAAPIRYANYDAERQRQLAASQMAPMLPFQLHSAQQAAPYEAIRNYLGLSSQVGGGGGEQSQPIYKNPAAGALGGGLAGYSLATGLGGAASGAAFGPWGAGIGALIGLMG